MKISYDHEVDALYILFKDTTVTTSASATACCSPRTSCART